MEEGENDKQGSSRKSKPIESSAWQAREGKGREQVIKIDKQE